MRNTRLMARSIPQHPWHAAACASCPVLCQCPHHGHRVPAVSPVGWQGAPVLTGLIPESCPVTVCDFVAWKLYLPLPFSSSGASRLLLLNITLSFPILFFLKIFQIFSKAEPQRMLFSSPQWAEEQARFLPTQIATVSHGFVISFQVASSRDPRAAQGGSAGAAWCWG